MPRFKSGPKLSKEKRKECGYPFGWVYNPDIDDEVDIINRDFKAKGSERPLIRRRVRDDGKDVYYMDPDLADIVNNLTSEEDAAHIRKILN